MAWTHTTISPRKYLKSASPLTNMASAAVYSEAFDLDLSNNGYVWMGINVSVAGADVAATLKLQVSYDGTNYTNAITLSSDIDPHLTGDKMFYVDLTQYRTPWMRFVFNDGALAAGTTGRLTFLVIGQVPGSATDPYAS